MKNPPSVGASLRLALVFLGKPEACPHIFSQPLRAADKQDLLRAEVAAALKRFYEERLNRPFLRAPDEPEKKPTPPPWDAPLKKLKAGKSGERANAAVYLRELLSQALDHETSGKAPWRSTPYWGGGVDVPARDLRKEVAEELAKAAPLEASLPLIRWYLEKERVPAHLKPVVEALGKLDGKPADTLRLELATRPHPNAGVMVAVLDQLTARKSALPAKRLAELCRHHRASVRGAARKLNTKLGREEPPAFEPKAAMRSKVVRDLMNEMIALIPDLPPAKAEFVRVTVRYLDDKKQEKEKGEQLGWQLERDKRGVTIYTPFASRVTIRDGERTKITQSKRILIGQHIARADGTPISTGMSWRSAAAILKLCRWDREAVRELGIDPAELAPRDREKYWYAAIGRANLGSSETRVSAEALSHAVVPLGYRIGLMAVLPTSGAG